MPDDPTEDIRRAMLPTMAEAAEEAEETWDTEGLRRDFEVLGFMAPLVVVRRRSDGVLGSLTFSSDPRIYFGWKED